MELPGYGPAGSRLSISLYTKSNAERLGVGWWFQGAVLDCSHKSDRRIRLFGFGTGCSGSDEGVDLIGAGLGVSFAEFDESADVVWLEEHHTQKVWALGLPGTESAREESKGLG